MFVIINADDFGYDENRSKAILKSMDCGLVTMTTAMANRTWFELAMELAIRQNVIRKVGLHFNLTEGIPLTEEMRDCRVFCDENGLFSPTWHLRLKTRLILSSVAQRAVSAEAKAQIEKFLDCGGVLMHLDSHHHVHTDFSVATVLFPIAKRYGFRSVRLSRTIGFKGGVTKRIYKVLFNVYAKMALGSKATDFTDFENFKTSYMNGLRTGVVEVMEHPACLKDGVLSSVGELYDMGRSMSDDGEFWNSLVNTGVQLVDYSEIR